MGMTKTETKVEGEENDTAEWMKVHVTFLPLDFPDFTLWWVHLCWTPGAHQAILSCPSSAGQGDRK